MEKTCLDLSTDQTTQARRSSWNARPEESPSVHRTETKWLGESYRFHDSPRHARSGTRYHWKGFLANPIYIYSEV